MLFRFFTTSSALALVAVPLCPASAAAQDASAQTEPPAGPDADYGNEEIVVTAERIAGQVQTNLPPIVELDEADIAAYGADSLADLVAQLAPQTGSGNSRSSGRPVFLINGRRVSGFREFRRYPPEAIRKVEVLPEEVALQYGYPATQRVINFILKDNFVSREVELQRGGPTAGGRSNSEAELSMLTINGANRLMGGVEYNASSMLTEAERGIIQTPGSVPTVATDPDPAEYRSLASDSESLEVETTWNTALGESPMAGDLSINGNFKREFSRSLSGLDIVALTDPLGVTAIRALDNDPLTRRTTVSTFSLGSSLNKPLGDWQLAVTLDAAHARTDSAIDLRRDTG